MIKVLSQKLNLIKSQIYILLLNNLINNQKLVESKILLEALIIEIKKFNLDWYMINFKIIKVQLILNSHN